MNGGSSVRWPDTRIARDAAFADQAALVEKREVCQIASKWTVGIDHPRGDLRRAEPSFEQGGVGTSVFRAFLLFAPPFPI